MNLQATQRAFQQQVLADGASLPSGWDARMAAGLAIYRNAYRSRLMDVLQETYSRTFEWIGEDAFVQAAAHHLITNPPSHWTLDKSGDGFPETLGALFARDPEVEELAWLEWAMQRAFTAEDRAPLDAGAFAAVTARFDDGDWGDLTLEFAPSLVIRPARTACAEIWRALAEGAAPPADLLLGEPGTVLVWREGFSPVFRTSSVQESECLQLMRGGMTFGALCDRLVEQRGTDAGIEDAGTMLLRCIGDGLVTAACSASSGKSQPA